MNEEITPVSPRPLTTAELTELTKILDTHMMKAHTYVRRSGILIDRIAQRSTHITDHLLPPIMSAMSSVPDLAPFLEGFGISISDLGHDMQSWGETILLISQETKAMLDALIVLEKKLIKALGGDDSQEGA